MYTTLETACSDRFARSKICGNLHACKEIEKRQFIFTAYADDTTFFLKNTESIINLLEIFKHFS